MHTHQVNKDAWHQSWRFLMRRQNGSDESPEKSCSTLCPAVQHVWCFTQNCLSESSLPCKRGKFDPFLTPRPSVTFTTVFPDKITYNWNLPSLSPSLSLSLSLPPRSLSRSLSPSCKNRVCFGITLLPDKSLHRHWTEQLYIYLCTMKMNAHFYISSWNEHSECLH